ncbi:hypothetical protein AAE478_006692 [Parahypoxylon ruwenzoriense]
MWAQLISQRLLKLKPSSALERTVVAFGIFFLSGFAHAVAARRARQDEEHRDLLFFWENSLLMGAEILISTRVKSTAQKTKYETYLWNHRLQVAGKALENGVDMPNVV